MTLTDQVCALHRKNPEWGATWIASELRCCDGFVRAVAQRKGLKLPRSPYGSVPSHGAAYNRMRKTNGF